MNNIIQKAIEGGWDVEAPYQSYKITVCDPLFWQALGKACGLSWVCESCVEYEKDNCQEKWLENALRFHEINLTEGWDKAVAYLEDLIK